MRRKAMKALKLTAVGALLASALMGGCVVAPGPDYSEDVAPPLPAVVDLDEGNYYYYGHHHYRYDGDRWHWANDRGGPWRDLPRDRWPREVRHEGTSGHERGIGAGGPVRHEHGGWHSEHGGPDGGHGGTDRGHGGPMDGHGG